MPYCFFAGSWSLPDFSASSSTSVMLNIPIGRLKVDHFQYTCFSLRVVSVRDELSTTSSESEYTEDAGVFWVVEKGEISSEPTDGDDISRLMLAA
jgi:hypothetical protein